MPGAPSLDKYLHDVIEAGIYVTACVPSKEMLKQMGVTPETLEEGAEFEDVIGFLNTGLSASKKGWYGFIPLNFVAISMPISV